MLPVHVGPVYDKTDPENWVLVENWRVESTVPIEGAESFLLGSEALVVHQFSGIPIENTYRYSFESKEQADTVIGIEENNYE